MRKLDVVILLASGTITGILLLRKPVWGVLTVIFFIAIDRAYIRGYKRGRFDYYNTILPKFDKLQEKIQSYIKDMGESNQIKKMQSG